MVGRRQATARPVLDPRREILQTVTPENLIRGQIDEILADYAGKITYRKFLILQAEDVFGRTTFSVAILLSFRGSRQLIRPASWDKVHSKLHIRHSRHALPDGQRWLADIRP